MTLALDPLAHMLADWVPRTSAFETPGDLARALNPKTVRTPALDLIDRALVELADTPNGRLIITMPPQEGKSTRAAGDFPTWWLTRRPDDRIIAASYSQRLADRNGRQIRNRITAHPELLGLRIASDHGAVGEWGIDGHDGGVYSVGVSGGASGRPCELLIIDDPIKSRAEADSEVYRDRVWDWWTDEASARFGADTKVALILCMTGDTPVLRPDGTETPLRDIRPGDEVATYNSGELGVSKVVNHTSQGYDSVYRITTSSGATVRANGRHPFLVLEDGVEVWRRTDQIKTGAFILRATGASTAESCAPPKDATNQQNARAFAARITAKIAGLTTATTAALCEGCCATTAISSSPAGTPPESFAALLNTWSVNPDEVISVEPVGEAEVFDVQIAGTENFIADGLVSHNTRWHHDDLAGRLIAQGGWRVLNIPAQADHDPSKGESDILGREPGEYMVSARGRTREQWEMRKRTAGSRAWASLYQGRPTPDVGNLFPADGWARYLHPLWLARDDGSRVIPGLHTELDAELIQSWDFAFKDTKGSDFVVGQVWLRRGAKAYVLDQVRRRASFSESCQMIRDLSARWPQAVAKLVEDKANGPAILNALRTQLVGLIPVEPEGSKYARASAITPLVEAGDVVLPDPALIEGAGWVTEMTEEAREFPGGKHDDTVDAMSQAVHRLLLVPILAGHTVRAEDILGEDEMRLDWAEGFDY